MIEAVHSVLSNAQALRGNVEQASSAPSVNVVDVSAHETVDAPKAPFISPYISVDIDTHKAVLQIRDSDTGDVVRQFPTERSLQVRRAAAAAREAATETRRETVSVNTPQQSSSDVPVPSVSTDTSSAGDVAQAQVASEALATGAQAGTQTQSAGVSVLA